MNYYVYYKVDAAKLSELRLSIEGLLKKINLEFKIQGRWMRRRDDPSTYMEVYEGVTDVGAFEAVLETEGPRVAPNRRLERFVSA